MSSSHSVFSSFVFTLVLTGCISQIHQPSATAQKPPYARTAPAANAQVWHMHKVDVTTQVLDLRTHRLPDRIVLSAYPVLLALLGFAAVGTGQPARLGSAVIGGLALAGAYVGLALAGPPGGLGLGDVKLAGLLGLLAGWFGLLVWVTALVAPFLLAAPVAVVALWRARGRPGPPLPLGPFMLAGCLLAVLGR